MWTEQRQFPHDRAAKYALRDNNETLRFKQVIELWCTDDAFRQFFVSLLKDSPFDCFRFEAPPITQNTSDQLFEFVLVDSPEIALPPDARDFQPHFDASAGDILVFDNLGGDATLIVPRPREGIRGYSHIADFVHHAPMDQQLALWRAVGETLDDLLSDHPLWLNTAGGGVPWLHVRLDTRPKYYVFDEFKRPPAG